MGDAEIRVEIYLPWSDKRYACHYRFDREAVQESLIPLPKYRELNCLDAMEAERQYDKRKRLVEMVANSIAHSVLLACEKGDEGVK